MARKSITLSWPFAATEEDDSLLVPSRFEGEVQKILSRLGIGDLDGRPFPGDDELVPKSWLPFMSFLVRLIQFIAQQPLESWSLESSGPHGPPDPDINEDRRLEPPAGFHSIDSFNEICV